MGEQLKALGEAFGRAQDSPRHHPNIHPRTLKRLQLLVGRSPKVIAQAFGRAQDSPRHHPDLRKKNMRGFGSLGWVGLGQKYLPGSTLGQRWVKRPSDPTQPNPDLTQTDPAIDPDLTQTDPKY